MLRRVPNKGKPDFKRGRIPALASVNGEGGEIERKQRLIESAMGKFDFIQGIDELHFCGPQAVGAELNIYKRKAREGEDPEKCFAAFIRKTGVTMISINGSLMASEKEPVTKQELRALFFAGLEK